MRPAAKGFSLLEVVVAVGVFALGIIVVIGLFAPLAKSVAANAEAEAAAHIADVIKAELIQRVRQTRSFEPVAELLHDGDAPAFSRAKLLFANREGTKLGGEGAPVWSNSPGEKFFKIALTRNHALSPPGHDRTAVALVYTARIYWPASVAEEAGESGANEAGQQVLLVNGSVRR